MIMIKKNVIMIMDLILEVEIIVMVYYYIIVTHINMEMAMDQCGEIMIIIKLI